MEAVKMCGRNVFLLRVVPLVYVLNRQGQYPRIRKISRKTLEIFKFSKFK